MSDDLVKRLRDLGDHASFEPHMHHTAADRIEALEAERDALAEKIADIVDAWEWWQVDPYDRCQSVPQDAVDAARDTLAQITGGKTDER